MDGPAAPVRSNTRSRLDAEGNRVEEWSGEGQPGVRTHDYSNEDEINQRLFGPGTSRKNTSTYKDRDGNRVETWTGEGSGPGIRTHDQSDEAAINERLFGKSAPKPPSRRSTGQAQGQTQGQPQGQTYKYRNADGDQEEVHAGEDQPGIRTHDHSNEDEINQRLFGSGAPKPPRY